MSLIYISDTNIWIDFRNAGLLEHMFRLPFTLCCTDFVMHELEDFPTMNCSLGGWLSRHLTKAVCRSS